MWTGGGGVAARCVILGVRGKGVVSSSGIMALASAPPHGLFFSPTVPWVSNTGELICYFALKEDVGKCRFRYVSVSDGTLGWDHLFLLVQLSSVRDLSYALQPILSIIKPDFCGPFVTF